MAPSSLLTKLRYTAHVLIKQQNLINNGNNNNPFDEQVSHFQYLNRLSSQKLTNWILKTMPYGSNRGKNAKSSLLNELSKNHIHIEAMIRLCLRDEYENQLTYISNWSNYLENGKVGKTQNWHNVLHGFGEIVNIDEDKRIYSSIFNNNTIGTGHARSKINSVSCFFLFFHTFTVDC